MWPASTDWNKENVSKLRKMWERGDTASVIAGEISGATRSSIIGKAHRLGLPKRDSWGLGLRKERTVRSPNATAVLKARRNSKRRDERQESKKAREEENAALDAVEITDVTITEKDIQNPGVPWADRKPEQCCWVLPDRRWPDGLVLMCGDPKIGASPYCDHHAKRARVNTAAGHRASKTARAAA